MTNEENHPSLDGDYTSCDASLLRPLPVFEGRSLRSRNSQGGFSLERRTSVWLTSGLMWGTTPPCEITTWPRSLFSLRDTGQYSCSTARRRQASYALFVVPNRKLHMTGDDTLLLVVPRRVTRELKDFSGEILEDRREVHYKHNPPSTSGF